jgi:hypothetical protein
MNELLNYESFKDLHKQWLVDFLEKGGFQALVNILNAFIGE